VVWNWVYYFGFGSIKSFLSARRTSAFLLEAEDLSFLDPLAAAPDIVRIQIRLMNGR
jgi:hypothetical protein